MMAVGLTDKEVVATLLERMERVAYLGLDPSTVRFNPRLLRLADVGQSVPVFSRLWRSLIYRTVFYLGHRTDRILRPQRCRFSKGLALCFSALAYLRAQAAVEENPELLATADHVDDLIEAKRLLGRHLWAHDYDYRIHGIPITTGTPNLVTTAFVANSFWSWWEVNGSELHKKRFLLTVEDMLRAFPLVRYGDTACFMYTPVTDYHVHNANLLMAELLAKRYSVERSEEDWHLVRMSVLYSLEDLRRTRSFPYAGPPTADTTLDNYHTGFVLRSLSKVWKYVPALAVDLHVPTLLEDGVAFYIDRFVRENRVWRDSQRVMNTHSLAESILIDKEFGQIMTEHQRGTLRHAIEMTARELWHSDASYFINKVAYLPLGLGRVEDRADMIRWSQAWMLYALSAPVSHAAGGARGFSHKGSEGKP